MGKREARKQEIIEQAFATWSRDYFVHTTMESVARAMGMTKPAIYRYFSNKEALLEAMRSYFSSLFDDICLRVKSADGNGGFEEAFSAYNEGLIRFFAEHPEYFTYAMVMYVPRSRAESEEMEHVERRHEEFFPDGLLRDEFGWSDGEVETVRNYIITTGGFVLSDLGLDCEGGPTEPTEPTGPTGPTEPTEQPGSPGTAGASPPVGSSGHPGFPGPPEGAGTSGIQASADDLLERNRSIVFEGFGRSGRTAQVDYDGLDECCRVGEEDLLEPDHIFSAIAEVVAESGLWNASLEKIARKAGMTKSSLYFYFENRNDMLWKMIDRERHHVGDIFLARTEDLAGFEEKLYSYFIVFGGYLSLRPDFLAVMNWFRFQRINFQVPNHAKKGMSGYVDFIREAMEEGKMDTHGTHMMDIVRFVHFIIINEINKGYWRGFSEEKMRSRFRILYRLFLHGAKGA